MATRIETSDLMPGGGAWWHRQPNPQMPTRTRGGGYRQPGVSEGELNEFQQQPQEPNQVIKNFNEYGEKAKGQAQKIAEQRTGGVLPEQKPVVPHTQRTAVDAAKANPDNVNAIQQELGLEGGSTAATQGTGTTYNSYDDILKLMRHNAVSDAELARRQRSREIIAGLGDTISAIANMWATTKGAPNSYDNSKGMSATAQERYARMLAERKAQQEQILNYYRVKRQAELEKENQEYRSAVAQSRKDQLEEQQRHNKELEKIASGKAETDKENKERAAAEKERSNKANEEERNRHNQALENKKSQGSTGGSSKKKKGKTHTGRKGKVYGSGKGKKRLY